MPWPIAPPGSFEQLERVFPLLGAEVEERGPDVQAYGQLMELLGEVDGLPR